MLRLVILFIILIVIKQCVFYAESIATLSAIALSVFHA